MVSIATLAAAWYVTGLLYATWVLADAPGTRSTDIGFFAIFGPTLLMVGLLFVLIRVDIGALLDMIRWGTSDGPPPPNGPWNPA